MMQTLASGQLISQVVYNCTLFWIAMVNGNELFEEDKYKWTSANWILPTTLHAKYVFFFIQLPVIYEI